MGEMGCLLTTTDLRGIIHFCTWESRVSNQTSIPTPTTQNWAFILSMARSIVPEKCQVPTLAISQAGLPLQRNSDPNYCLPHFIREQCWLIFQLALDACIPLVERQFLQRPSQLPTWMHASFPVNPKPNDGPSARRERKR